MSFSFDKLLRPITPTDGNIKIYEDNGILKYTINPFHIKNTNVLNNTIRINLDSDRSIVMVFSTNNEAKISLSKLQGQMDTLTEKVPFIIDKDILNYVTANIKIGPTGSSGRIFTGTSSTYLTIPNSGNIVQLTTQKDLAFVPGQTIVVYRDFPTNYYVEDYLDEPYYDYSDPVYMVGDVDTYDSTTGNLAFVAIACQPIGATSSFWYINLTGQRGQDGTSGTSGASAYQTWLNNDAPNSQGNRDEMDFLLSLIGPQGIQGLNGNNGTSGTSGISGASAYETWLANGAPNNPGTYTEADFLISIKGDQGIQGFEGPIGPTGSILPGNGLVLDGYTMSVGGTLYQTLSLNGGYNDLILGGFDNISVTSSVFDVVSDFISLDSNDSSQILSINDVTIIAGGELALAGTSGLVSIGNGNGLVYQSDYSVGFVTHSLVSKKYVDDSITIGTSGTSGTSGESGTSGTTGTSGTSGTSGITPTTDWSLSGSLTVSGTTSLTGHTIFSETSEVINVTPGATASTVVYDFNTGAIWYHATASTNYTANFTNIPTDNNKAITTTIMIDQGATGYIPTSVQIDGSAKTIKWANGTYSVSSNKVDIVGFTFIRAENVWVQVLGQISSFG